MKETKHHKGHKWTTDALREFMKMWEEQATLDQMAGHFGTSTAAISKMAVRLRQQGIPLGRRDRHYGERGRRAQPWTQEEVEYLFRRRLAGDTAERVAADLDRTVHGVHGMITALRKQGAPIAMRGQGVKRIWSVESLKSAAIGRFDSAEVALAEDLAS